MQSGEIRRAFLDFFRKKGHEAVPSAPMVVKNDPTLMFTNAGMNQFKDVFLGNRSFSASRVANSQKCLRVSGKHNDLEEVGHDTYHHTMFEMLGNWSFGDYFKKEAIAWAMEFLAQVMKVPKERMYATIFEGDMEEHIPADEEALGFWKEHLPDTHILKGSKKDNFWEMGDTGPCGPCSEIHLDIRPEEERRIRPGHELVNTGHPLIIEIWNLVFIQYNRKSDGGLEPLPAKHVDTGMGFERLCMVVQGKTSNYDTDIFQPIIGEIGYHTGTSYGEEPGSDTAMRVIADHLRAISFSIADGQIPSNARAGYVIRRILRRAVRYGYTFLKQKEPFIYSLVPTLVQTMGNAYPELKTQQDLIMKVIREEESSFLRTLETGIRLLDQLVTEAEKKKQHSISGTSAFELYDTYGFPLDLTELILNEKGLSVRRDEFDQEMKAQKDRSRNASLVERDDWTVIESSETHKFTGFDALESDIRITRYRKVSSREGEQYHLVFNHTPFYAESGGQVGDSGVIEAGGERIEITDTLKENDQVIHISVRLPSDPTAVFRARVDRVLREKTARNHSATHLLHHALRQVLGSHVEQKGSLVHPDYLRFDFSHFSKLSTRELEAVEGMVNHLIRQDLLLDEHREIETEKARQMGALALFGEKYGNRVRVIRFGESVEFCGGTHVHATGRIGLFKIVSESAVAAGIRRIEAITGEQSEQYLRSLEKTSRDLQHLLKAKPENLLQAVNDLQKELQKLRKDLEKQQKTGLFDIKSELKGKIREVGGIKLIVSRVEVDSPARMRDISFQLMQEIDRLFMVLAADIEGKAHLTVAISDKLTEEKGLNAGKLVGDLAKEIQGGGGGQPFFATAGGKDVRGIDSALEKAFRLVKGL